MQLLPELSESTQTQYYTEKKHKGLFSKVGRTYLNKIPFFSVILMCQCEEKMWETKCMKIYYASFLLVSAIKNNAFFIPFTIGHREGMRYPRLIANATSQTLTISVSASYTSPSASPSPSFFPSWCLFFICSDNSTHTLYPRDSS